MSFNWSGIKRLLPLSSALLAGVAAGVLLPPDLYATVTQELIALFGLMMAAVLPAMTLTASALRSGNLSRRRLYGLYTALRQQLLVWLGMFVISLGLCSAVVLGKILSWSLPVELPFLEHATFDLGRLLVGIITSGLVLFLTRAGAVGRGVLSILEVSREIAMSEAAEIEEERAEKIKKALAEMKERPGIGGFVDLPH